MTPNMLGAYGEWAAQMLPDPPRLSFRQPMFANAQPWSPATPVATLQHQLEFDGLSIEHLQWQLPYGPPTEALLLKPAGAQGKLPAVLGLHDHGGNKYFGWRKIAQLSDQLHPMMKEHRDHYYGKVSWANELARRGFAVLVHDTFPFASRRVRVGDVAPVLRKGLKEVNPESTE